MDLFCHRPVCKLTGPVYTRGQHACDVTEKTLGCAEYRPAARMRKSVSEIGGERYTEEQQQQQRNGRRRRRVERRSVMVPGVCSSLPLPPSPPATSAAPHCGCLRRKLRGSRLTRREEEEKTCHVSNQVLRKRAVLMVPAACRRRREEKKKKRGMKRRSPITDMNICIC